MADKKEDEVRTDSIQDKLLSVLMRPRELIMYVPAEGPLKTERLETTADELYHKLKSPAEANLLKRTVILASVLIIGLFIAWEVIGRLGIVITLCIFVGYLLWEELTGVTQQETGVIWLVSTGNEDVSVGVSERMGVVLKKAYDVLQVGGQWNKTQTTLATQLGYENGLPAGTAAHLMELKIKPTQPGDQLITNRLLDEKADSLYIDIERLITEVHDSPLPAVVKVKIAPQLDADKYLKKYKRIIKRFDGTSNIAVLKKSVFGMLLFALPPSVTSEEEETEEHSETQDVADEQQKRIECIESQNGEPTLGVSIEAVVVTAAGVEPADIGLFDDIENQLETAHQWIEVSSVRRQISVSEGVSDQKTDSKTMELLTRVDSEELKNKSADKKIIRRTKPAYITVRGADVWRYALISTQTTSQLASQLNATKRDQTITDKPSNEKYDKLKGDLDIDPSVDTKDNTGEQADESMTTSIEESTDTEDTTDQDS